MKDGYQSVLSAILEVYSGLIYYGCFNNINLFKPKSQKFVRVVISARVSPYLTLEIKSIIQIFIMMKQSPDILNPFFNGIR